MLKSPIYRISVPRSPLIGTTRSIACFLIISAFLSAQQKKLRLVLAIMVDQLRPDHLQRYRSDFNSGFARLLKDGAVFTDAQYLQAVKGSSAIRSSGGILSEMLR